jgi:Transposase DDE domain
MVILPTLDDLVVEVRKHLPPDFDFELTARARGAFKRSRNVKSAIELFRLAMMFGGCGLSLREICTLAVTSGLADLKDPSLIARLRKAAPWLGDILAAIVVKQAALPVGRFAGYRLRALDATTLCRPGADRTTWRLHVGYGLATGQVDQITLTDIHGAENLARIEVKPGDIVLADRAYARPRDLRPVLDAGANFIVRTGWNSLRLLNADGTPFDLFAALKAQTTEEGEFTVYLNDGAPDGLLRLRLVIRRKSAEQAAADQARLIKDASKHGKKRDPRTLAAAHYILLLTALPQNVFPAADVLMLYRFRWQIELAFKRMKSLAGLDELAAKTPELAKAWIYAKLIAVVIAEHNAGQVPDSPPFEPAASRPIHQPVGSGPLSTAATRCPDANRGPAGATGRPDRRRSAGGPRSRCRNVGALAPAPTTIAARSGTGAQPRSR